MAAAICSALTISPPISSKTLRSSNFDIDYSNLWASFKRGRLPSRPHLSYTRTILPGGYASISGMHLSASLPKTRKYEFSDGGPEVELRLDTGDISVESSRDIFVDVDDSSLLIRVKESDTLLTLMQADCLFERIKPAETIWYMDEDQLVVNLMKFHTELKWPDLMESWESLRLGVPQILKGTSIYVIGESTEINEEVAKVLAAGLGYAGFTSSFQSGVAAEGCGVVVEAEALMLESLSSHVRAVVSTLGGLHGAASQHDKWRHLYSGFTVWISIARFADESAAREEAKRNLEDGSLAYTNSDVVVKLAGWDRNYVQDVAQGCLKALKLLILSEKQLTEFNEMKEAVISLLKRVDVLNPFSNAQCLNAGNGFSPYVELVKRPTG
ncbi:putative inactive shikimate kinase like 2, chloroplastic [Apostasia shenzhenica]|uniref:Putative inactive shikimate kinase like 2, chloroplastic n=1 Tax=Apostasia shenzhenica TaxID=1088818 RepID=A0A2I0ACK6_9ASPA|nr:putative inactive shikimate kinase like 2, chloroplastic [Apostasia shenzhenica]